MHLDPQVCLAEENVCVALSIRPMYLFRLQEDNCHEYEKALK